MNPTTPETSHDTTGNFGRFTSPLGGGGVGPESAVVATAQPTSRTTPARRRGLSRVRGEVLRAAVEQWTKENPGKTREDLVRELDAKLREMGEGRDTRTIRRYLSGELATIPSKVADAIVAMLDVKEEPELAMVPWDQTAPLVRAWLALHPEFSKRALSVRLAAALSAKGEPGGVDYLQNVLAGKHARVGRATVQALRELLAQDGVTDMAQAARIEAERRHAVDGRALEPAGRLLELCADWKKQNPNVSGRALATMLHDRAKQQKLSIGFAQLERCVNGRTPRVRRAVRELMEELLRGSAPAAAAE